MYLKIHESYRKVVALCDSELVGKKFEEGKIQLDVRDDFYRGEEIGDGKAVEKLKSLALEDATFSIAGEKSVEAAIDAGIVNEEGVMRVKGIPFALVLL